MMWLHAPAGGTFDRELAPAMSGLEVGRAIVPRAEHSLWVLLEAVVNSDDRGKRDADWSQNYRYPTRCARLGAGWVRRSLPSRDILWPYALNQLVSQPAHWTEWTKKAVPTREQGSCLSV
jgi:hypothetical protein